MFILVSILIHTVHFVGDYYFQPYWMKLEKVEHTDVLSVHAAFYAIILFLGLIPLVSLLTFDGIMLYATVNGILHWCTDLVSAKLISATGDDLEVDPDESKPLSKRVDLWKPICFLGADQLVHHACLIATLPILFFPF